MYQAKVEVRQEVKAGSFTLIDTSIGDELPLDRTVSLRDGNGKVYDYSFDFTNEILVDNLPQDLAFDLEYTAVVDTPQFGSVYVFRTAFLTTGFSEDYLLSLQGQIHCNPNIDGCNDKTITDLLKRSSEVIYAIEAAQYFVNKCKVGKAQKILNYINDYVKEAGLSKNKNCGCGCS